MEHDGRGFNLGMDAYQLMSKIEFVIGRSEYICSRFKELKLLI